MLILVATLALVGLGAAKPAPLPKYVQAREAFAQATLYLQERLPDRNLSYHVPADRKSLALGLFAGLVGDLVLEKQRKQKYDPLGVLERRLPYLWRNYPTVALTIRESLQDALLNLHPVLHLIDSLCIDENDLEKCNSLVDQAVKKRSSLYKEIADLLLLIGQASNSLNSQSVELDRTLHDFSILESFVRKRNDQRLRRFVEVIAEIRARLKSVSLARRSNQCSSEHSE